MAVLVTGGAGYIGAHMLLALLDAGEDAVALDNLSTGAEWMTPEGVPLIVADVGDEDVLKPIFRDYDIREVIHFAGSILVPESIENPLDYYNNNTTKTLKLLRICVEGGVKRFIFSSTAAVYGTPERVPITEQATIKAITPYGASMAMSERILEDVAAAHDLSYVTLRYFNVAGADPDGRAGELGIPTHLIKAAAQIAIGAREEKFQVYGGDYNTPDGAAIRDYVHVTDLADAHLKALKHLRDGSVSATLNCGYGRGYSVFEVLDAFKRVMGRELPYEVVARRAGDPPQLIADNAAIRTILDWRPRYDEIDFIVETALKWEQQLADKSGDAL